MIQNLALKGLLCMIGSFTISLAVGLMYLWGIMTVYATSYFRIISKDSTITQQYTDIVFPLTLLGQAISMPFAARMAKKTSSRMNCMICGLAMTFCLYMASYCTSLRAFALLYGLGAGLVTGIIYIIPIAHCHQYFPNKKSSVSIILVSASGIGTLIFAFIGYNMMNFDNMSTHDTADGFYPAQIALVFPEFLRVLSGVMLALISGGGLLLFEFPAGLAKATAAKAVIKKSQYKGATASDNFTSLMELEFNLERQDSSEEHSAARNPFGTMNYEMAYVSKGYDLGKMHGNESDDREFWPSINQRESQRSSKYHPPTEFDTHDTNGNQNRYSQAQNDFANECPRTRDGPKQPIFWKLFIIIVLGTNFGLMTSNNYKTYAKSSISDEKFLVTTGALAAVACGFSRFFWGLMLEKLNAKTVYSFMCILNAFFAFTLFYIKSIEAVYFVYVIGAYVCYGGHLGMFPAITSLIFGPRYSPQIYGILFLAFPLSAFVQYFMINLFPKQFEFGYWIIFMVTGGMSVLALLMANRWIQYKRYDWSNRIRQHNERKRLLAR